MNTPVNFELAKLLTEKNIIINSQNYQTENFGLVGFDNEGEFMYVKVHPKTNKFEVLHDVNGEFKEAGNKYYAPTISDVVMWLYEKYGIWISVQQSYTDSNGFSYSIKEQDGLSPNIGCYNTPKEAYEKAIEYTLNNLI